MFINSRFKHFDILFRTVRRMTTLNQDSGMQTCQLYLTLLKKNSKRIQRIRFLSELFKTGGYELKIAGGAVRDLINNIEPKDIDFATNAHPDDTLKLVERHPDLLRVIVTAAGLKHGTVAVKFKGGEIDISKRLKISERGEDLAEKEPIYDDESPFEITTLRCDKLTDGRHAEVEFISDWRKDAERRDLTINSMFLNIDDGKLIDYFGGEEDCKNRIVRFVGDADLRIREDYLRILRFFRFWSRISGEAPLPDQIEAIKRNLDGLKQISGERIWQELKKIFMHLPCSPAVKLLIELRLFEYAGIKDPSIADYDHYLEQVSNELKTVETRIRDYCEMHLGSDADHQQRRTRDLLPAVVFATCIRSEQACLSAHNRLKFSNLERDTILYIIENRDKDPPISAYKYQLAMMNGSDRPQTLLRMKAVLIYKGRFDWIDDLEKWKVPQFPLSGKLIATAVKGRKLPSSTTREVIERVKLEWAKRNYDISEDELQLMMKTIIDQMASST